MKAFYRPLIFVLLGAASLLACTLTANPVAVALGQRLPLTKAIPVAPFSPSPQIAELANDAMMSEKAKEIFYATDPEIDADRATFEQHCQAPVSSNAVELGCYTSDNRIYILGISAPQLREQMVVTAAHEMLHAAYAQLSAADRARLNGELEAEVTLLHSPDLNQELRDYRLLEPGQLDTELHSLLGTEYAPLAPQLEQYYGQYFSNRLAVVRDWQQFNQVFSQLKARLYTLRVQIAQTRSQMNADLRQRNRRAYNALVPQFNALVQQYNQTVAQYNALSRSLLGQEAPATNQ